MPVPYWSRFQSLHRDRDIPITKIHVYLEGRAAVSKIGHQHRARKPGR